MPEPKPGRVNMLRGFLRRVKRHRLFLNLLRKKLRILRAFPLKLDGQRDAARAGSDILRIPIAA